MSKLEPAPAPPKVEAKVKASTFASYLAGLALLAVLNGITDTNLVAGLPDWLEVIVAPFVPAVVTLAAGYIARHTPRPDLPMRQR